MVDFLGAKTSHRLHRDRGRMHWDVDALVVRSGPKDKARDREQSIESGRSRRQITTTWSDIANAAKEHDIFVLSDEIYSRILYDVAFESIADFPQMAGAHLHPRWFFQDLCHDRLEARLRRDARVPRSACRTPGDEFHILHRHVYPACGGRGAHRTSRRGRQNGGGVPPATRSHRRGAQRRSRAYIAPCPTAPSMFSQHRIDRKAIARAADYLLYEADVAVLSGTAFGSNGEGYLDCHTPTRTRTWNAHSNDGNGPGELPADNVALAFRRSKLRGCSSFGIDEWLGAGLVLRAQRPRSPRPSWPYEFALPSKPRRCGA